MMGKILGFGGMTFVIIDLQEYYRLRPDDPDQESIWLLWLDSDRLVRCVEEAEELEKKYIKMKNRFDKM